MGSLRDPFFLGVQYMSTQMNYLDPNEAPWTPEYEESYPKQDEAPLYFFRDATEDLIAAGWCMSTDR